MRAQYTPVSGDPEGEVPEGGVGPLPTPPPPGAQQVPPGERLTRRPLHKATAAREQK